MWEQLVVASCLGLLHAQLGADLKIRVCVGGKASPSLSGLLLPKVGVVAVRWHLARRVPGWKGTEGHRIHLSVVAEPAGNETRVNSWLSEELFWSWSCGVLLRSVRGMKSEPLCFSAVSHRFMN